MVKWLKGLFLTSLAFSRSTRGGLLDLVFIYADSRKATDFTALFTCDYEAGIYRCNGVPARYYSYTVTRATWRDDDRKVEYAVSRPLIAGDIQFVIQLNGCAEAERTRIL
jgi:hypothetical protein